MSALGVGAICACGEPLPFEARADMGVKFVCRCGREFGGETRVNMARLLGRIDELENRVATLEAKP